MTVAEDGGIFVSYRRYETGHLAGRLADRLADRFGEGRVFIDVDAIEPGVDFAEEISRAVATCKVLLAVIGPNWLTTTDEQGRRRLDDPDDIVRLEIEAALVRNIRVIPILVEGAVMPGRQYLPDSLVGLARRNALLIRHESFRSDVGRLVTAIERALAVAPDFAPTADVIDAQGDQSAGQAVDEMVEIGSESDRSDLTRAARLLADAEEITRSAPNKSFQGEEVLIRIAWGLVAIDPKRAAQLFTDAEDIARSLPEDRFKTRIRMLILIARGLVATDPDRAARLFTDAEYTARSLPVPTWQAKWLSDIAWGLATIDADRAARLLTDAEDIITRSLSDDERSKIDALIHLARGLAATDPDGAARLLTDAEDIARSFPRPNWQVSALILIARGLVPIDPGRAARLLTEAEDMACSLPSPDWKESALSQIAHVLMAIDADHAEDIARSLTDAYSKALALSEIAQTLPKSSA